MKNWCFWTVVLEKTLESPLDRKKIKLVSHKGNKSWIQIGKTDAEAEALILLPPDVKRLTRKEPDAGKVWRQEEKGTTEDEMVGWHHWLNGHEFEQALGVGDGQGSLAFCHPWGCKELDTTEWLNWSRRARNVEVLNIWIMWYPSYAYLGSSYWRIDGLSVFVCLAIAGCLHGWHLSCGIRQDFWDQALHG